jgi:hypothetical protein
MDSRPAVPAPSGYTVDLKNPKTDGRQLGLWIGAVGIAVSTLFLILRLSSKIAFTKALGLDDVFITLSWALATAMQGLIICKFTGSVWGNVRAHVQVDLRLSKRIGVHMWEITIGETEETFIVST